MNLDMFLWSLFSWEIQLVTKHLKILSVFGSLVFMMNTLRVLLLVIPLRDADWRCLCLSFCM